MNKIFDKFLIGVLFILGITLVPAFKADAGVVDVTANYQPSSLTVSSGTLVTIRWGAPWASSCSNNFNSSDHSIQGTYTYTASNNTSSPVATTFTVNCEGPDFVCPSYTLDSVCPPSPGLYCTPGYTPLCFSGQGNTTCFQSSCAPGGGCNFNTDPFRCEAQTT